jgi:MFS family permease
MYWRTETPGGLHETSIKRKRRAMGGSVIPAQAGTQRLGFASSSRPTGMGDNGALAPGGRGSIVRCSLHAIVTKLVDSPYAVRRLLVALALMTIGNGGMYVVVVVLPAVQAEFGVARAAASLPYTLLLIGFGLGGILMGRLADRRGVMVPLLVGAMCVGLGFLLASWSPNIWWFAAAHCVLIGFLGSSASFAPLIADASLWFVKRRGIAVAVCASGNYLSGALWPPVVSHFLQSAGWRATYFGIGIFCMISMTALALFMRGRPPTFTPAIELGALARRSSDRPFGLSTTQATGLLCVAGLACCVAMSMPLVHIVALCGDLGFGPARGAQMLALMLGLGIVSRLASGLIVDRIGGLWTLLIGSTLQCLALVLFLPADGLWSLYLVSALFGLFQGGIVPSYAIVIREYFSPKEAGARVGTVLMFTLFGMALGGWMSGKIFDLTGSYDAAFVHGIAWNVLNMAIVLFLMRRVALQRVAFGRHQPIT